jgi:hypothetical protein
VKGVLAVLNQTATGFVALAVLHARDPVGLLVRLIDYSVLNPWAFVLIWGFGWLLCRVGRLLWCPVRAAADRERARANKAEK